MLRWLTDLLGPYILPVVFGAGVVAGLASASGVGYAYVRWVHDPSVRSAALKGFVKQAQVDALAAALDEAERQIKVTEDANGALRDRVDVMQKQSDADRDRSDQERRDYEEELKAAGRSCPIDQSDLDFLLRKH